MNYQIPDFEAFLKLYPNLGDQTQAVGQIYVDAVNEIVKEQGAAAETLIDLGAKAFQPAQANEPAAYLQRQVELQGELYRALGASAERIFSIAGEANNKAFNRWMAFAAPAEDADGTDA